MRHNSSEIKTKTEKIKKKQTKKLYGTGIKSLKMASETKICVNHFNYLIKINIKKKTKKLQ